MTKLLDQFNSLETDEEKWKWVLENKDKGITVYLDNDDTFIQIYEGEDKYGDFSWYIGNSLGVTRLLEAIGVEYKHV